MNDMAVTELDGDPPSLRMAERPEDLWRLGFLHAYHYIS